MFNSYREMFLARMAARFNGTPPPAVNPPTWHEPEGGDATAVKNAAAVATNAAPEPDAATTTTTTTAPTAMTPERRRELLSQTPWGGGVLAREAA